MTEATDWAALVTAATTATTAGKMGWIADNATTLRWQPGTHVDAITLSTDGTGYVLRILDPGHHELGSTTSTDTTGLDALWTAAATEASGWPAALTSTLTTVQGLAT